MNLNRFLFLNRKIDYILYFFSYNLKLRFLPMGCNQSGEVNVFDDFIKQRVQIKDMPED